MVTSARAWAWVTPRRASRLAVAALVLSIAFAWIAGWALGNRPVVWVFWGLSSVSAWAAMAGLGAALGLAPRKALGYAAAAYLGIGLVVHLVMLSRIIILTWPAALFMWMGIEIGVVPPPD